MELALYAPAHGYYAGGRAAIGRRGDYLTSVSTGPLFGRLLSDQFEEMWRLMGRPAEFTLLEQGANTGDFAHDVLVAAGAFPEFFQALRYRIVEPFPVNKERQRARLAEFCGGTAVEWYPALAAAPGFTGVHFSNELLDAMPVHLLVYRRGEWLERYVSLAEPGGEFVWTEGPFSNQALEPFAARLPRVEGYRTEINLAAHDWLRTVNTRLERGYVLVADYGFSRNDFYHPDRREGTLCCYRSHRRSDDPLVAVGEQDITAHVEFTSLVETGMDAGLELAGFADQHRFMIALGKHAFPDATEPLTPARQKEMRAFATLMHPALLGRGFQFLALSKTAPRGLRGFEFATDPVVALELQ